MKRLVFELVQKGLGHGINFIPGLNNDVQVELTDWDSGRVVEVRTANNEDELNTIVGELLERRTPDWK